MEFEIKITFKDNYLFFPRFESSYLLYLMSKYLGGLFIMPPCVECEHGVHQI